MIARRWRVWAALLGVAIPFGYQIFGEVLGLGRGIPWLGLAAGVLALGWLVWRGVALRKRLPPSGLEAVLLISLAALLLSLVFSPDPRMGLEQALWSIGYVALFYFLVDAAEAGASRTGAIYGMLLITGLVAVLAVLETYFWYLNFWQQAGTFPALPPFPYRLVSVLGHPNFYMAFVNLPAPLAVVIFARTPRRSVRFLAGVWLAFYFISAPFSSSRGGWLGMAAWMGVLGLYWALEGGRWRVWLAWLRRRRVLALLGGAALVIIAVPVLWKLYLAFAAHPSHGGDPFGGRSALWGAALNIWRLNPITGVGVGRYLYEYLNVNPDFPPGFWSFHAHNLYLTTLAEQGAFGFLALLALVGGGLVVMVRWQRGSPPRLRPWTAGMLAGVVGWLVHSIFDDFTTTFPVMIQVTLLLAFLRAGMGKNQAPWLLTANGPLRALQRLPLAVLLGVILPAVAVMVWLGWAAAPLGEAVDLVDESPVRPGAWHTAAALAAESARRDPAYVYYQVQAGLAWAKVWEESGSPADLALARRYLSRALDIEPAFSLVWANAAVLDWQAGERRLALERMARALAQAPREPSYPLNLGRFYEQQGDADQAARWYAQALKLAPELASHPFWQVSAPRRAAAEEGRRAFEKFLTETPPYWKIAQDALQAGNWDAARTAAAHAQAAGEDELAVLAVQASLANAEGRSEDARRFYRDLLEAMQGDFLFNRAYIARMYARFHKRPGFDLEVVPGYLLLKPDYGQTQALHALYRRQVTAGDCAAAEQTWRAVMKSGTAEGASKLQYPGCGAPLPEE